MNSTINLDALKEAASSDRELAYKMRAMSGVVRIELPSQAIDFEFDNGRLVTVREAESTAAVTISAGEDFWTKALSANPGRGYESLTMAMQVGATVEGDFAGVIAPYQPGLQRLYRVFVDYAGTPVPRAPYSNPFRDTDNAVGRYVYVTANDAEARIYYETAGNGPIPLLLQATAGADGRQYRHLLADPAMQSRFTMYAYDLPFHGKSLPPTGVRWWEQAYLPGREYLENWVVAIADALKLDQPYFMGCSVGGQLALDLAADHGDRFGAFVSLNGWYDNPGVPEGYSNDLFRTPSISAEYAPALNFGATAPSAPEEYAHEVYFIYRSNFPGIYAGDNDYFMYEHNLAVNGHNIDARRKPVYVIAGEYDPASFDQEHGGPAVEAKIDGAVFIETPRLGHFAISDDPIGFSEAIVPILDKVIAQAQASKADRTEAQR